jgi:hypothetical protein
MEPLLGFRETKAFTRDVDSLLGPDSYHALQIYLQRYHELGKVIEGSRGIGKSGGIWTGEARVVEFA